MEKEKITIEAIDKLAELSQLEFTPDEKEQMLKEVSGIIEMLNQCGEIHVDKPYTNRVITLEELREDEVKESLNNADALRNAPKIKNGYLGVPKVVE